MKLVCLFLALLVFNLGANEVVNLPFQPNKEVSWQGEAKAFFAEAWGVNVVSNVSTPSMTIYRPDAEKANGKVVIIAPGGALYYQSIESEGTWVADWLTQQGYVAAVLKYRLVPTTKTTTQELDRDGQNRFLLFNKISQVMPLAVQDGLSAISYFKQHYKKYNINQDQVGFMGFSAGGALAMGVGYNYNASNRPDFLVTVYPWTEFMPIRTPQKNSPPLLIICASDDQLDLAPGAINLYNAWYNAGASVALHMYAKGGHGFGMHNKGIATDSWIERFYEWQSDITK